jgi:hypothetical protein
MMSETEAGFALMPNSAIVAFIKAHQHSADAEYEVVCACRVLGETLLKRYRLWATWQRIRPKCPSCGGGLCSCGGCHKRRCSAAVPEA